MPSYKDGRKNITSRKILVFSSDMHQGGVAVVVSNFLKCYALNTDHELHLCIYDNKPLQFEIPPEVAIHRLKMPLWKNFGASKLERILRGFFRYPGFLIAAYRFKKLCKSIGPDLILSHSDFINVFTLFLKKKSKRLKNLPVIVTDHSYNSQMGLKKLNVCLNQMRKRLYRQATKVVAISRPIEEYQREILGLEASKILRIPNGVDLARLNNLAAEPISEFVERVIFDHPVVIHVGRLTKPKGQWHLIRAFAEVKLRVKDAKLVILGDGELRGRLSALVKALKLEDDIFLLGHKANPFKYLSKARLFALPSLWEGFPMVLIEAMACRLPVLATDCKSGPRDILHPISDYSNDLKSVVFSAHGILTPSFDGKWRSANEKLTSNEKEWAAVIAKILKESSLHAEYSERSYRRAQDFDLPKLTMRWADLIEATLFDAETE